MGLVTAKDRGAAGCDVDYGYGVVKAKAAFEYLQSNGCDSDEAFREPKGGCMEVLCTMDTACDDGNTCTEDTCEDGVCRSEVKDGSVPVTVLLLTDNFPNDTEWKILNASSGDVMLDSGSMEANALHTSQYCSEEAHNATFTITDSYGDGICCEEGTGGYEIKVGHNQVAAGGDFGSSETKTFAVPAPVTRCVDSPAYKFAWANECRGGAPLDEDQCEALAS